MFDIGDSDQPRSCFTWRGAFAAASSPPASPCGDTDGYIEGVPTPDLRALTARFGSLAQGLVVWPMTAVMAVTLAKSSGPTDSTSAAARRRARLVPRRRFCLDRKRSGQARHPPATALGLDALG